MRSRLRILIAVLFFLHSNSKSQVCQLNQLPPNLQSGLVAYYPFCGNLNDISGNNNVGVGKSITFQNDRFGNPNSTASFNKANQSHIAFLNNTNFQQTSFTLSTWFNTNSISTGVLGSGNDQFIAGHSPFQWLVGPAYGMTLDVVNNADIFSRMWTPSTSWQDINAPRGLIRANTWYHALLVYDGVTKIQKFYLNGNLIGEKQSELSYANQAGFFIGGSLQNAAGTIGTFFNGLIDDVGFWNRPLSSCEIQQLYTASISGFNINQISGFNPLPDSLSLCGNTGIINGPDGFSSYLWSNGVLKKDVTIINNGLLKLSVYDQQGCIGTDSVYVNIINANILQTDTTICSNSDSITLSINPRNAVNTGCTGAPTIVFNDWTQISPNGNFTNIIKHQNKYYIRSMLDVFESNSISGTYSSLGFASQIGNTSAGSMLGFDNIGRIHVSTSHASLYVLNGTSWSANGLSGFGTGGNFFIKLSTGRILISKGGFLRDIYYSDNNGTSWINATNIDVDWNHLTVASNGYLYAGSAIGGFSPKGLLRSIDNGTSWQNISSQLSITGVTGISNACNGNLYLAADSKLYKSENSGINWVQIANLPSFFQSNPIYGKLLVASNGEIFYYGYIDANRIGLFSSKDNGQNWTAINIPGGTFNEMTEIDSQIIILTSTGIFAKTLMSSPSIKWSTGETTNKIKVRPSVSTKYYVNVSDGTNICQDSISVNIQEASTVNIFSDTVRVCGSSYTLTAGNGFDSFVWNTGATTQTITPTSSGFYKVFGTKGVCSVSDSTYLSLVQAKILQRDTTICRGASITLSIDSTFNTKSSSSLPNNLRNGLVAYYPFNGNANDESGNGNNGIVKGASLTTDRFGNNNSAYNFDGNAQYISVIASNLPKNDRTISAWINIPVANYVGMLMAYGGNGSCGSSYFVGINHRSTNQLMVSGHCANNETQANYVPPANQWVNLVSVSSSSGTKIYANGILIGSSSAFFSNTNGSNLYIGSSIDFAGINPFIDQNGLYWKGKIDDFIIWNRALNEKEVNNLYKNQESISWSTGDTTSSITVSPTQTTKYFVTVSDGITVCTDSVLVKVSNVSTFNPFPDTLSQCGKTVILDAGGSFSSYTWNNGASTKSITINKSGYFNVKVTDADGCIASDTTLVSLVYVNIDNSDTTVCAPVNIQLKITDTLVSQKGGWELLIPASSFNFAETNFREGGFDSENAKLYSVFKNGSVNRFYVFDLNQNTVQSQQSLTAPAELYDYVYDFTNSRIIGTRVGRDRMYTIPLTGGTWTPFGNGSFDAESYGCATFWNPVSRRPGFFGGYGFFSVKNWVWENNGNAGWQNVFANTNNCQPPKRIGQMARNKIGDKLYIFSGQGSCDGNQFASSCSLSQPWATDVGIFCWLKDLWELDLNTYTFKNILPPNSASIVNEGGFAYDYNNDIFYNVGGFKPLPTFSSSASANLDFGVDVYRFRRGVDNGFELMPVGGIKPPVLKLSQYSGRTYYDAKNNRVIWARNDGIWALNLGSSSSVKYKYKWSTGDTTTSINVSPTQTTTYYVNVTDGITTCTDSIKVTVDLPLKGIRYPTQDLIINRPTTLNARNFGRSYLWSPDAQLNSPRLISPIVTPAKQQQYTVTITTAAGCVTVDTVLVRVFPNINIYVPDGFSPDGDGRNDKLYPIPIGIREIRMFRVYNRWGTLVYDNKNANMNTGWDGTYLRIAQPMESYVWVAEGIDNDGKYIRRTGNTILIR